MNKIASLHRFLVATTAILGLAYLSACSRGGNNPDNWNNSSMNKLVCKSPEAFNLNNINANRFEKLQKSSSDDQNTQQLYVVRTIVSKDLVAPEGANVSGGVISVVGPLPTENSAAAINNSPLKIGVENINCENMTATYRGAGVNQDINARITRMSHKAIRLEATNQATNSHVMIEVWVDRPSRQRSGRDAHNKYVENYKKGLVAVNVRIIETFKTDSGTALHDVELRQEAVLNEDVDVTVGLSVVKPMIDMLLEKQIPSPETAEIQDAYQKAVSSGQDSVTAKFSQLLKLRQIVFGEDPMLNERAPGEGGTVPAPSSPTEGQQPGGQNPNNGSGNTNGGATTPAAGVAAGAAAGSTGAAVSTNGRGGSTNTGAPNSIEAITNGVVDSAANGTAVAGQPGSNTGANATAGTSSSGGATSGAESSLTSRAIAATKNTLVAMKDCALSPVECAKQTAQDTKEMFNDYARLPYYEWRVKVNTEKAQEQASLAASKKVLIDTIKKEIAALEAQPGFANNVRVGIQKRDLKTAQEEFERATRMAASYSKIVAEQNAMIAQLRAQKNQPKS